MGSCFSKTDKLPKAPKSQSLANRTAGQNLSKPSAQEDSRQAAARAAEQRQQAHKQQNMNNEEKLRAMQKVSKKEKGLA